MFDFSREHMTFLIGLFFLAVLAMVCVAIFSRGKVSLAGKWVVREYRVENRAIKREEAELQGGKALSRWNTVTFTFTPEGHVFPELPDQENKRSLLSYRFDGHHVEISDPERKSSYRLLELTGNYLAFSPPYGKGLVILLEKE